MSKSGNRHVRGMTTELAWSGLRFQPESALSGWFRERFGDGGKRLRRIGMVAVAQVTHGAVAFPRDRGLTRGSRAQSRVSAVSMRSPPSAWVRVEAAR
jgi:hypothetical protein